LLVEGDLGIAGKIPLGGDGKGCVDQAGALGGDALIFKEEVGVGGRQRKIPGDFEVDGELGGEGVSGLGGKGGAGEQEAVALGVERN
jgi:hypothetical protein